MVPIVLKGQDMFAAASKKRTYALKEDVCGSSEGTDLLAHPAPCLAKHAVLLSDKHKKLLKRQANLIRIIEEKGKPMSSTSPSGAAKKKAVSSGKNSSKSNVRTLAKRIGIWDEQGKLAPAYRK
jgi:hypothetical protein